MAVQVPALVTFRGAADVLNRYVRAHVRAMAKSADADLQQRAFAVLYPDDVDGPAARRLRRGVWCTPRQVQYMAAAIGQTVHEPKAPGDTRLIDAVEVGFLGIILMLRLLGHTGGARMWAGLATVAPQIRNGLRVPSLGLGLEIDARGFARVGPFVEPEPEDEFYAVDLAGVRKHVDQLIARHYQREPFVWSGWRLRHMREMRKELRTM